MRQNRRATDFLKNLFRHDPVNPSRAYRADAGANMSRLSISSFLLAAAFCAIAAPASALDCKAAASKAEKAICADPAALAADSEMSKAYGALHGLLDAKQHAALIKSQVQWLTERDGACFEKKDAELSSCLAEQSNERRLFLSGGAPAGPGYPGKLIPAFRIEPGGKGRTDVDIEVLKFPAPANAGERAFNVAVDKLSGDIVQPEKEDAQRDDYAYSWKMHLVYASPRLLSAHADGYSSTGGAHPNSYSHDINIDLTTGREATFDSLLDKGGAEKIFALCLDQVVADRKSREGADGDLDAEGLKTLRKDIATATGALDTWRFGAEAANVSYDPYAVGSYVEGDFTCKIPYAILRPLAKPGFPLP
jgi:uncharacterized protein YecT (DUF1311 family)